MQCSRCKSGVQEGASFCWRCGAALAAGAPPAAPVPSVTPRTHDRAGRGTPWAIAAGIGALLALVLLAVFLARGDLLRGRLTDTAAKEQPPGNSLVAGTPGKLEAVPPLTGADSGSVPSGPPVTTAPAGNLPTAPGLQEGGAGATVPDPYVDDVAAYLRKLEAIQARDAQNPMAQLTALMGAGLNAFTAGLKELEDDYAPPSNQEAPNYARVFSQLLQRKQAILRDFNAITPVPPPCYVLHQSYRTYLSATVKAVAALQRSVAGGAASNPTAPLAALPLGQAAESAQQVAQQAENAVRQKYRIPRGAGFGAMP